MTRPMARALARHNIRVVTLAPGPFATPLLGQLPDAVRARWQKGAMLYPRRFGIPEEFADTVKWILECPFINGETLRMTAGGRSSAAL